MSLKNIVIVGASGNFGTLVIPELIKSDLSITAVIRQTSSATFPSSIEVAKSDFTIQSLTEVFKGKDVVISMLPIAALADQAVLIEAAIAAGVKRFIPSEYGCDSTNPAVNATVPVFEVKTKYLELLASKEDVISWTGVITGPFFDWGFFMGLTGFNTSTKTATIVDGGDVKFSTCTGRQIGRALIAILNHPTETANKLVFVDSFTTTQNEVFTAVEKVTGKKWKVEEAKSEDIKASGFKKVSEQNYVEGVGLLIQVSFLGKEALCDHTRVEGGLWNDRLGLERENLEKVLEEMFENSPAN